MRKIIGGRTYNTATSKVVGEYCNSFGRSDFRRLEESLYKNTKGAYFLHGSGGPMTRYARQVGDSTTGGSGIIPLTTDEAREWAEKHLAPEEYEAEFGEVEEATGDLVTRERVNLTLDSGIMASLRQLSDETGVPMSKMVDKAILAMYGDKFKG